MKLKSADNKRAVRWSLRNLDLPLSVRWVARFRLVDYFLMQLQIWMHMDMSRAIIRWEHDVKNTETKLGWLEVLVGPGTLFVFGFCGMLGPGINICVTTEGNEFQSVCDAVLRSTTSSICWVQYRSAIWISFNLKSMNFHLAQASIESTAMPTITGWNHRWITRRVLIVRRQNFRVHSPSG
jgi:hypothetical protein